MGKPIAVEGVQFEISEAGTINPSGIVSVSSQCQPCANVSIQGKKAYAGQLLVEVSGFTSALISNWVPGSGSTTSPAGVTVPGSIVSTVQNNKTVEGLFFLEGDQASSVTIFGQMTTSSGTVNTTTTVAIKIKDGGAGQNVVNAT